MIGARAGELDAGVLAEAFTVLRKELQELTGDLRTARSALVQAGIMVFLVGVQLPSSASDFWVDPCGLAIVYSMFPALLSATLAADAFAGERERRTLETLLATPLSDAGVFLGKVAWPVGYAVAVALASAAAGLLTSTLAHGLSGGRMALGAAGFALLCALGASVLTSASAVLVSTRLHVARSVEQTTRVLVVALGVSLGLAVKLAAGKAEPGWGALLLFELGVLLAGACTARMGARFLARDRVFEGR